MKLVKTLTVQQKIALLGKTVHMTANCEFFPNFDVKGKLVSWNIANNGEFIYTCKISSNKNIQIGTNMNGLSYEII